MFRWAQTSLVVGRRMMSQQNLAGKVAIVTASTDGIGLAAAQALGLRGAHVVVSSRRKENVEKAVALLQSKKIKVTGTTCNVGKREDRERLVNMTVEQCGGVDILVSNAAVNPFFGNILDSTEEVWDKILDVNVKAAFLLTKLTVPHMEERGGGSVVFVSSVAGYQPMQALGPYSVSKTALLGLTRALAPELAHCNIRVNCVAPGVIQTRFSSALWQNEDIVEEFKKQLSIKRLCTLTYAASHLPALCVPLFSEAVSEVLRWRSTSSSHPSLSAYMTSPLLPLVTVSVETVWPQSPLANVSVETVFRSPGNEGAPSREVCQCSADGGEPRAASSDRKPFGSSPALRLNLSCLTLSGGLAFPVTVSAFSSSRGAEAPPLPSLTTEAPDSASMPSVGVARAFPTPVAQEAVRGRTRPEGGRDREERIESPMEEGRAATERERERTTYSNRNQVHTSSSSE
ncbi:hypothetical protein JZ751_016883, partial [Albula glossodonta]